MRAWHDAEPNTFSRLMAATCLADAVCPTDVVCPRDIHRYTLRVRRA